MSRDLPDFFIHLSDKATYDRKSRTLHAYSFEIYFHKNVIWLQGVIKFFSPAGCNCLFTATGLVENMFKLVRFVSLIELAPS